jgi:hypothetical protein
MALVHLESKAPPVSARYRRQRQLFAPASPSFTIRSVVPRQRRLGWIRVSDLGVVEGLLRGRTVLLTTHYMESRAALRSDRTDERGRMSPPGVRAIWCGSTPVDALRCDGGLPVEELADSSVASFLSTTA